MTPREFEFRLEPDDIVRTWHRTPSREDLDRFRRQIPAAMLHILLYASLTGLAMYGGIVLWNRLGSAGFVDGPLAFSGCIAISVLIVGGWSVRSYAAAAKDAIARYEASLTKPPGFGSTGPIRVVADDQGLHYRDEFTSTQFAWPVVAAVDLTPWGVSITTHSDRAVLIPRAAFESNAAADAFKTDIEGRIDSLRAANPLLRASMGSTMHCAGCNYPFAEGTHTKCPECGRDVTPHDLLKAWRERTGRDRKPRSFRFFRPRQR